MANAPFELTGRQAVVTGAGSGIGRAVATRLAEAGAHVTCADVDGANAKKTANSIIESGGSAAAAEVDVSRRDQVEELVAATPELAIMCNVAGVITNATIVELTDEDLNRVLAVNFFGTFYGSQAAARAMIKRGGGSIINMLSSAVDHPAPSIGAYAMSKAAARQLTLTLAAELAPQHVRVNAVAPGFVVTGMTARHYTDSDGTVDEAARRAYHGQMMQSAPLGVLGDPDDIAYAVLYLASDASRFMTGQVLRPNGGVAMPG